MSDPLPGPLPLLRAQEIRQRAHEYLAHGGVWNPELMPHDKVSALVQDMLACLESRAGLDESDDCGLSIDMLDADRLRTWAEKLDTHGPDVSEWASRKWLVEEMRRMADDIEQAVKDIGTLRATPSTSSALQPIIDEMTQALSMGAFFNPEQFGSMLRPGDNPILRWRDALLRLDARCARCGCSKNHELHYIGTVDNHPFEPLALAGQAGPADAVPLDFRQITRLEVINESGRLLMLWDRRIEPSVQDDGRTLKLFARPLPPADALAGPRSPQP